MICYNSIGQVYIKQKKYTDAQVIIEKALEKALINGDQFLLLLGGLLHFVVSTNQLKLPKVAINYYFKHCMALDGSCQGVHWRRQD